MWSKIKNNFLWQREDEPQNVLAYVFLYINMMYGIVFIFFTDSRTVERSAFEAARIDPQVWGVLTVALVLATLYTIAFRPGRAAARISGAAGVVIWGYGFALYAFFGLYFAALAIYLPQMVFWTFWYIGTGRFFDREEAKIEVDRRIGKRRPRYKEPDN